MIEQQEQLYNPFPGLRPFETEENYLFFGRDGQSRHLREKLEANRFVAVVGTSGSGKSSLVRAGLLPALFGGEMFEAGSCWRIAMFRPEKDPIGNLARALSEPDVFGSAATENTGRLVANTETTLRRSSLGLVEAVRQARMDSHENLLIVVDQFEELFRFNPNLASTHSKDEAAAFVKLILEAIHQAELPIYVVITMRSDYLGDCAQFRDLPEAINRSQYLIPRMSDSERREAITGPIMVSGGEITLPLVNRLINDVGDNPDQLPILQHALMRTWDYWKDTSKDSKPIDIPHYEKIGGMTSALSLDADKAYEGLSEPRRRIAEKLFKCLTEKGPDNREVRRPAIVRDICDIAEADEKEVIAVINCFRTLRRPFLTPPESFHISADTLIDISHESLIRGWQRLKDWVDEEALSARAYKRLADNAAEHDAGRMGLLRDPELQLFLDWRDKHKPNKAWASRFQSDYDAVMAFLDKSEANRKVEAEEKEKLYLEQLKREQREEEYRRAQEMAEQKEQFANAERQLAEEKAEIAQTLAEEQTKAATRLRRLVVGLVIMFLLSTGTAVYAIWQRGQTVAAWKKADAAATIAQDAWKEAKEESKRANEQADFAQAESKRANEQAALANERRREVEEAQERFKQEHLRAEQQAKAVGEERLKVLQSLGGMYREAIALSKSDTDKAVKKLENILELYKDVRSGRISTLLSIGELYNDSLYLEQKVKGASYLEEALKLFEDKDLNEKTNTLYKLGGIYSNSKDKATRRKAIDLLEQALKLDDSQDRDKPFSTYLTLGRLYIDSEDKDSKVKAIEKYKRAAWLIENKIESYYDERDDRNAARKIDPLIDDGTESLLKVGSLYRELGEDSNAANYYNKAVLFAKQMNGRRTELVERSAEANTLIRVGAIYYQANRKDDAKNYFDKAVDVYSRVKDLKGEADTLKRVGQAIARYNEREALRYYINSAELFRTLNDRKSEASLYILTASAYNGLKEPEEALSSYNKALRIYREDDDFRGQAVILDRIGTTYVAVGNNQSALESFNKAISLYHTMSDQRFEALTLNKLAATYLTLGQPQVALDSFNKALPALRNQGDTRSAAISLSGIGNAYLSLNKYTDALNAFTQALEIFERYDDEANEIATNEKLKLVKKKIEENQR